MTAEQTTIKLDQTNNWTGLDELPFDPIAERLLQMEAEENGQSHQGDLTVTFGKPVYLEGKGWAAPFTMLAMGREHAAAAGGADAVQALQMAFHTAGRQLEGMRRRHRITLAGSEDLGFGGSADPTKQQGIEACPVAGMSMSK
jgi:hypothetical protein